MTLPVISPKPGHVVVYMGTPQNRVAPCIVVGPNAAGRMRVLVRDYFAAPDGQLFAKKGGLSLEPSEFYRVAQDVFAALAGDRTPEQARREKDLDRPLASGDS